MRQPTCHPNKIHQAKGLCRNCYKKQWEKLNPDKAKINQKRRQMKDKTEESRKLNKYYRAIKSKYNLDSIEYERMLKLQNKKCALCFKMSKLHVDHDHKNGRVRGLVCHKCNWFLGTIDKDVHILRRLIMYKNSTLSYNDYMKLYSNNTNLTFFIPKGSDIINAVNSGEACVIRSDFIVGDNSDND